MTHASTATESEGGGGSVGSGAITGKDADGNTVVYNPNTKQWQIKTPIAGGVLGEALVGAGQRVNEYWQGIQGMGEGVMERQPRLDQMAADREATYPMEATSAAYRTAGPMLADLGIGMATPVKGMIPGMIASAGQAYLPMQENREMAAGIGAATSLGGHLGIRAMRGIWAMGDEAIGAMGKMESQRMTQGAKTVLGYGGEVPPSQLVGGSELMQRAEAGWRRGVWTGAPGVKQAEHNAVLMNQKAARAIGEDAADVGTVTLETATENIGKRFDEVLEGVEVPASPELLQEITDTVGNRRAWARMSKEIAANDYVMTGEQAKKVRRMLSDYRKSADPINRGYAEDAMESFDKALDGSNLDQEKFKIARQQWKNLKLLESPGVVDDLGNVNERALLSRISSKAGYGAGVGKSNQTDNLLPETREMVELSRGLTQIQSKIPRTGELPGSGDILSLRSPLNAANATLARLYYKNPYMAPMLDEMLRTTPTEEALNVVLRSQGGGAVADELAQ